MDIKAWALARIKEASTWAGIAAAAAITSQAFPSSAPYTHVLGLYSAGMAAWLKERGNAPAPTS